MKNAIRHIVMTCTALTAALCMTACGGSDTSDESPSTDFELICTTDVHGSVLNADFMHESTDVVSLANVMTYLRMARETPNQEVILLDNGDLLQGNPSMYYYNVRAIRDEHLATRVAQYMGYDAINLGNHDFECGEGIYYDHICKRCSATLLCANEIDTRTKKPMFKPYKVIERGGFRIAVLGLTHAGVTHWLSKAMFPHLQFSPMTESARYWIPKIRHDVNPDMLVVMFHCGADKTEFIDDKGETYIDGVEEVVSQFSNIDLVIIGHDHKYRNGKIADANGDSIPVVQPRPYAQQLASVKFTLTHGITGTTIKYGDIELIDSKRYIPDAGYCRTFRGAQDSIENYLNNQIAELPYELDSRSSLVGPSNAMDFIHSVQLEKTGAEISLACAVTSFHNIPAGKFCTRQIFDIYEYENQITKMWMTGEEVKQFLEYGYGKQFGQMLSNKDHVLNFRTDRHGQILMGNFGPELEIPQYNFVSAAGINYTVDISKPAGSRVTIRSMADGVHFDPYRRYYVVLSSYQASGGGGFVTKGLGWNDEDIRYHTVKESTKDMRYFIAQYIRSNNFELSPQLGHWEVIPHDLWLKNKEQDIDILLPYIK